MTADSGAAGGAPAPAADSASNGKTFTQEEVDRIIRERLASDRAKLGDVSELKRKAEAFDQQQEASRTDAERAAAQIATLQAENDRLKLTTLRTEIGAKHGLTPTQAKRLAGANEDELTADAAELAKDLGIPAPGTTPAPGGGRPAPATRAVGSQSAAGEPDPNAPHPMDDWMRERAHTN